MLYIILPFGGNAINCHNHPENEVAGACVYCGKLFCQECLVEIKGKFYCKADVGNLLDEAKQQTAAANPNINNPPSAAAPAPAPAPAPAIPIIINNNNNNNNNNNITANMGFQFMYNYKSRGIALVLCFFLGWLGIHRYYTGKVGTGVLYMLTFGLFGFGILIDLIMLLAGVFRDKAGMPLV
jgi:hypothetical protein